MTINLTQKGMINNFAAFTKGDFYWRLKNSCQHQGNPEDETTFTAKHKRVLPIRVFTRREHEHEIFTFLAVIFQNYILPILRVGVIMWLYQPAIIIYHLKSSFYNVKVLKN